MFVWERCPFLMTAMTTTILSLLKVFLRDSEKVFSDELEGFRIYGPGSKQAALSHFFSPLVISYCAIVTSF